ncbi:glycosyltransferase family 2 protein [Marinomonas sp. C2222]|uniref:Glycosyltransferase family 2 protein n=1 Tax=Marinomonas sargassi TaxID=2984494 RepID=A0ABT2YNH1_9GAMM|nr:glycosyltransferase [Marinomonas sargassi]MCV2401427.1 glycosyltransferase family 2 protein [Marinomonas sargassi]
MKISAFTFIKNGQLLGYPFLQSIESVLDLVDEFVISVGDGEDNTLEALKSLNNDKIRIIETNWNDKMRSRGYVYGQQKMIAQFNCTGDWAFYLEADEIVHEEDIEKIRSVCQKYLNDPEVEGIAFDYIHFWGNENTYIDSSHWYRSEVRIIRNSIRTYAPDGLYWIVLDGRKGRRYPKAIRPGIKMYHYGWTRTIDQLEKKDEKVSQYWNRSAEKVSYDQIDPLIMRHFTGKHPKVMQSIFNSGSNGMFIPKPKNGIPKEYKRYRLKDKIEKIFNVDLSKKHYKLVKN